MEETSMKYDDVDNYEVVAGERIGDWMDQNFTYQNKLIRKPTKDELEDSDITIKWMFTAKGERLYCSYVSKANLLGNIVFPGEDLDVSHYTNVFCD